MVDTSRRIDMTGNDVIVNSISFSNPGSIPTGGAGGQIVLDTNGQTPVTVAGTSATITVAQMATGLIISSNAAATTLTIDTAANMLASLANLYSGANATTVGGTTLVFDVSSHGAAGVTVAVGTGGTLASGSTGAVATGTQKTFWLQFTNVTTAPAYNLYA